LSTDAAWEAWGRNDPYYSVVTNSQFRRANLSPEIKAQFFAGGEGHVQHVMQLIHSYVDGRFTPKRVLDFGCGVGRVLIPFAKLSSEAVGLDVSPTMIAEAKANCKEALLKNVRILQSDDELTAVKNECGTFDLVHSCLVFQHIPVERGMKIFQKLIDCLAPNGVGVVQFIYAKDIWASTNGVSKEESLETARSRQLLSALTGRILSNFEANKFEQDAAGVPIDPHTREPVMEMNNYPLNEVLFLAQQAGAMRCHVELASHGGELGAFLFFQKPALI